MNHNIIILPVRVLYTDAYNIKFFKKKKDAERFARTKRLSKIEIEGEDT